MMNSPKLSFEIFVVTLVRPNQFPRAQSINPPLLAQKVPNGGDSVANPDIEIK
jgi:hypothetical protein